MPPRYTDCDDITPTSHREATYSLRSNDIPARPSQAPSYENHLLHEQRSPQLLRSAAKQIIYLYYYIAFLACVIIIIFTFEYLLNHHTQLY